MNGVCTIPADTGAVRAVLFAVECNTRDFAHQGYVALTGGEAFQSGLTLALTIYVALVGYRLLFAPEGARLTDAPRMALKVGAVARSSSPWSLTTVVPPPCSTSMRRRSSADTEQSLPQGPHQIVFVELATGSS